MPKKTMMKAIGERAHCEGFIGGGADFVQAQPDQKQY